MSGGRSRATDRRGRGKTGHVNLCNLQRGRTQIRQHIRDHCRGQLNRGLWRGSNRESLKIVTAGIRLLGPLAAIRAALGTHLKGIQSKLQKTDPDRRSRRGNQDSHAEEQ